MKKDCLHIDLKLQKAMAISAMDKKILESCYEEIDLSSIGKLVGTPRSSLYPYVRKLVERGFLLTKKKTIGNLYKAISSPQLSHRLINLGIETAKTSKVKMHDLNTNVRFFIGKKQIEKILE